VRKPYTKHGALKDAEVKLEFNRCKKVGVCALCGQLGASLMCEAGVACGKAFHFPCARLAAMDSENANRPTFSVSGKRLACCDHAADKYVVLRS
jgi:hypothetical protein